MRAGFTILSLSFLLATNVPHTDGSAPDRALLRGVELTLNEEFGAARAIYDSLMSARPTGPQFIFYRAMADWRWALNLEDGESADAGIRNLLGRSIDLAEKRLRKHGDSAGMYLWLGNAYGLRTGLEMLRGNVLRGALDGYKARECLFEAVRLDSTLVDARFGIGLTDYVLSQQPPLLRAVQKLLSLPSGDREGGLRDLDRVIEHGRYCRADAVSGRAFIDLYYERDYPSAARRFTGLLVRYPRSIDYRIRYLDALLALTLEHGVNHRQALVDSARSIRRLAETRGWTLRAWRAAKLGFIEGIGHYLLGYRDLARQSLERYLEQADRKSWLLGPTELTLGKLADLRGERDLALAHYRKVLKREDVWGSRLEAANCLETPFAGDEPDRRPPDRVQRFPHMP